MPFRVRLRAGIPRQLRRTFCALAATASALCFAQAPAADACIDEFIQRFETEDDGMPDLSRASPVCAGHDLRGPPPFPRSSSVVTLEYSAGDLFAVKDSKTWFIRDVDTARGCWNIELRQSRVVRRVIRGERASAHVKDGVVKRSQDTGEDYGSMIALGASLPAGPAPGFDTRVESTPFGVSCNRATPTRKDGTTLCTVPLPRSCAARRVILPIETRNPLSAGRTTSLQVGPRGSLVDRARWNLP